MLNDYHTDLINGVRLKEVRRVYQVIDDEGRVLAARPKLAEAIELLELGRRCYRSGETRSELHSIRTMRGVLSA